MLAERALESFKKDTVYGKEYTDLPFLLEKMKKIDQNDSEGAIRLGREISSTIKKLYQTGKIHRKEGESGSGLWLKPDNTKDSTLLRVLGDQNDKMTAGSLAYPVTPSHCRDLQSIYEKISLLEEVIKGWHFSEIMHSVSDGVPGGFVPAVTSCYRVLTVLPTLLRISAAQEAYWNDLSDLRAVACTGLQYPLQMECIMEKRYLCGKGDTFIHAFNHKYSSGHFAGHTTSGSIMTYSIVLRTIACSEFACNSGDISTHW